MNGDHRKAEPAAAGMKGQRNAMGPSQALTNVLNTNRASNNEEDPTGDVYSSKFKNKTWKFATTILGEISFKEFGNTNHIDIHNEDNFYSLINDP